MGKKTARITSVLIKKAGGASERPVYDDLVPRIRFWRKGIEKFLAIGPHTRRMRERYMDKIGALELWERYCLGEIKETELFGLYSEVHKAPFLPWIGPRVTFELLDAIWTAEKAKSGTTDDFLNWVKFHFTSSGGCPVDLKLYEVAQKAVALREKRRSWMQIAIKLCPDKKRPNHKCAKNCADKMRMAVKQFES
jgi:hypothetical protein